MHFVRAVVLIGALVVQGLLAAEVPEACQVEGSCKAAHGKTGGISLIGMRAHSSKVQSAENVNAAQELILRNSVAEFIAMTLFVIFGCGSAMGIANKDHAAWILQVSLTFGLAITVLAYTIGHYSGGQINCAVTFGLVLAGKVSVMQGLCNFVAQMLGSVFGAAILSLVYSDKSDRTGGFGSNGVNAEGGFTQVQALVAEIVATFLLMYTVFETAINPASLPDRQIACIAIGFAVFLAHSVLIPIDGCSINPTRSFGPALMAKIRYGSEKDSFKDMWVFWVGPLLGAGLATFVYKWRFAGAHTLALSQAS